MIVLLKALALFCLICASFVVGYYIAWPLAKWIQGGFVGRPDIGMINGGRPQ